MRKLSVKDKIILTILFATDQFLEFLDYCENPYKKRPYLFRWDLTQKYLERVYGERPLNLATSRLRKEKVNIDKKKCELLLDPHVFRKKYYWRKLKLLKEGVKWDHWWRVVMFDIPEEHRKVRSFLRYHLKNLGFVMWQKSVWVTIFDVKKEIQEVLSKVRLENHATVLEAKTIGNINDEKLIRKLFPVSRINQEYLDFINLAKRTIKGDFGDKESAGDKFLEAVIQDPGIPDEFLSPPNVRRLALNYFQELVGLR